jgi:hypothetical protein
MAPYSADQIDGFTGALTRTYGIERNDENTNKLTHAINFIWKCTLVQEVQTLSPSDYLAIQGIFHEVCVTARAERNAIRRREILQDFFTWHDIDQRMLQKRYGEFLLYRIALNRAEIFHNTRQLRLIVAIRKKATYFRWPTFNNVLGADGEHIGEWSQQSLLRHAGYMVGENAENDRERHRLLANIYLGSSRLELDVIAEYGAASSAKRLKEMARRIASWIRLHSRQDNYRIATSHWRLDLEYLKVNFYDGVYDFDWPL